MDENRTYSLRAEYQKFSEIDGNHGVVHIYARGRKPVDYWGCAQYHDFAGMIAENRIKFEFEHRDLIGYAENPRITEEFGLELDGHIFKDVGAGAVVYPVVKNGVPMEASITFEPLESVDLRAGETLDVNGETVAGPLCVFTKWVLKSVSLCAYGVDDTTRIDPVTMSTKGKKMAKSRKYQAPTPPEEKDKEAPDVEGEEKKPEDEEQLSDEDGAVDSAAQIAELEAQIAALTAQLDELKAAAGAEPTVVENSEEDPDEEDPESAKKEMSRIRKQLSALTKVVNRIYANAQLGVAAAQSVKREDFNSTFEYLSALETARLKKYHK